MVLFQENLHVFSYIIKQNQLEATEITIHENAVDGTQKHEYAHNNQAKHTEPSEEHRWQIGPRKTNGEKL